MLAETLSVFVIVTVGIGISKTYNGLCPSDISSFYCFPIKLFIYSCSRGECPLKALLACSIKFPRNPTKQANLLYEARYCLIDDLGSLLCNLQIRLC